MGRSGILGLTNLFAQRQGPSMWVWLDRVGLIIFDASLSTAIFSSFVVLAMLVCRQPSRRILIARAGLVASLAIIPLVALAPLPRLDIIDTAVHSSLVPAQFIRNWEQLGQAGSTSAQVNAGASDTATVVHLGSLLQARPWLRHSITLIVMTGMALGLLWLLLGFFVVRRLVHRAHEPSTATKAAYERLFAAGAGARARAALRVTPHVRHPVLVVGVYRPTILIPPHYDDPESDADHVRLSLLHETAHAEVSDAWFGALAGLTQSVWFFLPQTWWIRSQLLIDQEFMADRWAALRYGTSSSYAASLLSLADSGVAEAEEDRPPGQGAETPAVHESDRRSPLFQRVLMLLYCPFRVEPGVSRPWSWTLRTAIALASIMAACVCLRWPDARAIEQRLKHAGAAALEPFRVADFVAEPLVVAPGGRAVPHIMPVVLSDQFELTADVWASKAELAKIYVAGYALADATAPAIESDSVRRQDHVESWHSIRLWRSSGPISLAVDGRAVALSPQSRDASGWLTFEPSSQRAAHFRNLMVRW